MEPRQRLPGAGVDAVPLAVRPLGLGGADGEGVGDAPGAAQEVGRDLEQKQVHREAGALGERAPEHHRALGLEVALEALGQDERVGAPGGVVGLAARACGPGGAARARCAGRAGHPARPGRRAILGAHEPGVGRDPLAVPHRQHAAAREVLGRPGVRERVVLLAQPVVLLLERLDVGRVPLRRVLGRGLALERRLDRGHPLGDRRAARRRLALGLSRMRVDAPVGPHRLPVVPAHRPRPREARALPLGLGRRLERRHQQPLDEGGVGEPPILLDEVGRDGPVRRAVAFEHELAERVAHAHAAVAQPVAHDPGVERATRGAQAVEHGLLRALVGVLGEGLQRVERDLASASGLADGLVHAPVAQPFHDAAALHAEEPRDAVGVVPAHPHHAREGLVLVEGLHGLLRDVLGERDRGRRREVVGQRAAGDRRAQAPVRHAAVPREPPQRREPAPAGEHAPAAALALDDERVEQPQRRDRGGQRGEAVVVSFLPLLARGSASVERVVREVAQRHLDRGQLGGGGGRRGGALGGLGGHLVRLGGGGPGLRGHGGDSLGRSLAAQPPRTPTQSRPSPLPGGAARAVSRRAGRPGPAPAAASCGAAGRWRARRGRRAAPRGAAPAPSRPRGR